MKHVLVVDDEPAIGRLLKGLIEPEGVHVSAAISAEQALVLAAAHGPAVAMCDVRLQGGQSGFWLAEQLRNLRPDTAVVMVTGLHDFDSAVSALRTGVMDYVAKPFNGDGVRKAFRRALDTHDARRTDAAIAGVDHGDAVAMMTSALLTVLETEGIGPARAAQRVAQLSTRLAESLQLAAREVNAIVHAALLTEIRRVDIHGIVRDVPCLKDAGPIVAACGECFDGSGFPMGLAGDRIPRGARILAVARAYEELLSSADPRVSMPADAVAVLNRRAHEFDPVVLEVLASQFAQPVVH